MSSVRLLSAAYREVGAGAHTPPHRHTHWQWFVVTYGEIELTLGGHIHVLQTGQSLLVDRGKERSLAAHGAAHFAWVVLRTHHLDISRLQSVTLSISPDLQPDVHAFLGELIQPGSADTTEFAQALMTRILISLKRSLQPTPAQGVSQQVGTSNELVERVEAYMNHHLHEPLTREHLGQAAHLSPSHLARVFREATGRTLHQRLTELRLQRARELLLDSTMSITQIAQEVGFQSFSHFTSTFKDAMQVTPSHYRTARGYTRWFPRRD